MISINFIFNFTNFYVVFFGILFSTEKKAVVIAMRVILGILFLTSFILSLRSVVVVKLVY